MVLALIGLMPLARGGRARWLLAGVVLTTFGVVYRASPAGIVLLPGLLALLSAPLMPDSPADRARRAELEHDLAAYLTPAERSDLEATLDRYPDGSTGELRDILAGQAAAVRATRIPGA